MHLQSSLQLAACMESTVVAGVCLLLLLLEPLSDVAAPVHMLSLSMGAIMYSCDETQLHFVVGSCIKSNCGGYSFGARLDSGVTTQALGPDCHTAQVRSPRHCYRSTGS